MKTFRTIRVAAVPLVIVALSLMASAAYAVPDLLAARKTIKVGTSASSPAITLSGVTGNATFAGTVTATGGVVGGTSNGTFADGDATLPGMRFTNDPNNGWGRDAADNLFLSIGGTKRWSFSTTTSALTGALTVSGATAITGASTLTGAVTTVGAVTVGGALISTGAATHSSTTELTGDVTFNTDWATVTAATGASTWKGHMDIGGGYGATGADIGTDGAIRTNGTLVVDGASTLTGATGVVGALTVTGATALNGGLAMDTNVLVVTDTTGAISWVPTVTTAVAGTFNFSALTTSDGLKLIAVDATLDGGKYINCYGESNATSVWSIGELGTTLIGGAGAEDVTAGGTTKLYVVANQATAGLTGDLIAVHGNARVGIDSTGNVIAGYFQAGNYDPLGTNIGTVRGVYVDVVNKPSVDAASTWTNARGYEVSMDLDQGTSNHVNTVTNAYMFYGVYNAPTVGTYSTITNGYGIYVKNEAVGGTGQALDAAFYAADASMSGDVHGWDYGLDLSGVASGNYGSADIKLANGETIDNTTNGTIAFGGKLGVTDVITQTVTSSGTSAEYNGIVQTVTVGTNNTGSIVGTSFSTNGAANKTSGNIIGLWASADQVSATSVVSGLITGAYFDLNLGAATGLPTGTGYGVVIENSDWSNDRAYRPKAFVAFLEGDNGATLSTTALFDIGAQGKPVTSAADCTQILNTDSPGAVDCGLRILINNEVYYILMVKGGS